jgi:hypothetical protein
MKHRLRPSLFAPLVAVIALAIGFPGYAARLLSTADQFAVLSGSTVTATSPSAVTGRVGAAGAVTGPLSATQVLSNNAVPVPAALADLADARAEAQTLGNTLIPNELAGATYPPGVYHITGAATLANAGLLQLSGFGVYVFNIDSNLTAGDGSNVALINGANAANVYWNVGGAVDLHTDSDFVGNIFSAGGASMASAGTLVGKLLSQSGPVTLGGSAIVDSVAGSAPAFTGTLPADGSAVTICVGDTLTYTVTGQDPDGNPLQLSVAGKPVGASQLPNVGGEDTAGLLGDDLLDTGTIPSSRFSWAPQVEDVGTYFLTYSLIDSTGVISQSRVTLTVSRRPVFAYPPTPADGQEFVLCPGQPLTYTVTANDDDALTPGSLTLSAAGVPAGMTHLAALPNASAIIVSTTASFTPTAAQAGERYTIVYTAADSAGCSINTTVKIRVENVPTFVTPTPEDGTVITVCAGDLITYRVRAADADTGELLTLTATGLPGTASQVPALPANGSPVESTFSWTPTADEAGVYNITYTVTDNSAAACSAQTSVTLNVLEPVPTSLDLVRTGTVSLGSEMCFTATVKDQCDRPLPGQTVYFNVTGTSGNNQTQTFVTDASGQAKLCFTPRFPGTDTVMAWVDLNGNAQADPGEPLDTVNQTIMAPPTTIGAAVNGGGLVSPVPLSNSESEVAQFFIDALSKRTGAVQGTVTVALSNPKFSMRSTKLTGMLITDGPEGRNAIILGIGKTNLYGKVPFRVDVLDAGTPGVPNDRFFITFLTATGPVTIGSNLRVVRGHTIRLVNDIKVRTGIPVR